ncbi:MAG: hypothetical protein ACRDG3_08895 [Tepidiformaceae bacterium]
MTVRKFALCLSFAIATIVAAALPAASSLADSSLPYNVVSDSYYHLDVANGTMSVTVKATFYNAAANPLLSVPLWTMPGAANVVVKQSDTTLKTESSTALTGSGLPPVVLATLPTPLAPRAQVDVVMTYGVVQQAVNGARLQAGAEEALFVDQGQGSFVIIDMPSKADNYLDPGCVQASNQPDDVKAAGYERWICGEMLGSVFGRSAQTEAYCAAMDDKCRQRSDSMPYSAFGQSLTDLSVRGTLTADVQMQDKLLHVTFRYFKSDDAWAQQVWAAAKAALPLLEKTYGYAFPFDTLNLRESSYIELGGAAGISYNTGGDVLLAPDPGYPIPEVVVHELGHQWAGGNEAETWIAEGLAEYGMRTVAPQMGFAPIDYHWQSLGYTDNLALWGLSDVLDASYWYGRAGAFFFAYQQAIGGQANMTKVLAQTSPASARSPFDSRWYMDAGEYVSGTNLDSLFTTWVFNPASSAQLVKDRRAAHDLVATLDARAATLGLTGTPKDIRDNLDAWVFPGVAAQVKAADTVLDDYAAVLKLASGPGLSATDAVANSWRTQTAAQTDSLIAQQTSAINALIGTAIQLNGEPADSPAQARMASALKSYQAGDFTTATKLASDTASAAANGIIAQQLLATATETQKSYHASFVGRIGLLFADPAGELAKAQKSYDSGDPEAAINQAQSAINTWNGANSAGLERLAILVGILAALSMTVWWLLRRLDPAPRPAIGAKAVPGAALDDAPARPNWRDWENKKTPDPPS